MPLYPSLKEPHSLEEGSFLREFLSWITDICPDTKPVRGSRKERNAILLSSSLQQRFDLGPARRRQKTVRFCLIVSRYDVMQLFEPRLPVTKLNLPAAATLTAPVIASISESWSALG